MILDAELVASSMLVPPDGPRAFLLGFYPAAEIPPETDRDEAAEPLAARVNHGYWIASCPCGAEGEPAPGMLLWLSIPWMWCVRCSNAAVGGQWRPVAIPQEGLRTAIETVLGARARQEDQSWHPEQSVGELVRESLEHGEPVPREA